MSKNKANKKLLSYQVFDATISDDDHGQQIQDRVAEKLKNYLYLSRKENAFDLAPLRDKNINNSVGGNNSSCLSYKNYVNREGTTEKNSRHSKAVTLANEVRRMQSLKYMTEKEIETKKKLEIHMPRHNNPFILSPYAHQQMQQKQLMKRRPPKKRILSASTRSMRTESAHEPRDVGPNEITTTEREQILNLTAKLLVATEKVALPKNRHQSREMQTSTEEYFPSRPSAAASFIHDMRTKSSYSDPGVHTLTKERVESFNSPSRPRRLQDELSSADSGSLNSLNKAPFNVENSAQGYVIRKKPASYPSSLASQNSKGSPRVMDNFTVIKDKEKTEDLESLDDDYFDHVISEPSRGSLNSIWFDQTQEKQHADASTHTIQNRGTQTCKQQLLQTEDSFEEYNPEPVSTRALFSSHGNSTRGTQIQFPTQINSGTQVQEDVDISSETTSVCEVVTQTSTGWENNNNNNMTIQTQTNFEPKVITYEVYVLTGDVAGSSTTSDIKINIFGDRGDSGYRSLLKSKTSKVPFQRGQVDVFDLDCKVLGNLSNIRVGHNGTSRDDGWYLEKIHIKPGQKSNKAYTFVCNKWLSAREGDGQIMRDVILSQEIPVSEIPPVLPRKALRCRDLSEESDMSDVPKTKLLKSKATREQRDKVTNNDRGSSGGGRAHRGSAGSKEKKKHKDKNNKHHKNTKLHHRISSSGSESNCSLSDDSDTEKEMQWGSALKNHKRLDKHLKSKHTEKPQASIQRMINSITKNTNKVNLDEDYSTDTSISSAYEKDFPYIEVKKTEKDLEKKKALRYNILEPIDKVRPTKYNSNDLQSPQKSYNKNSSGRESLEPPQMSSIDEPSAKQNDIHEIETKSSKKSEKRLNGKRNKNEIKPKLSKKNEKENDKRNENEVEPNYSIKKEKESDRRNKDDIEVDEDKERNIISPIHLSHSPLLEAVIVPQVAEMVNAADDSERDFDEPVENHDEEMNEEISEISAHESSSEEDVATTIANETEEEKVEISMKDTRKQVSEGNGVPMKLLMTKHVLINDDGNGGNDDTYMAGFRAGITANRSKDKSKEEAVKKVLANGPTVHQACEDGNLDRLKELVEAIPDIKTKVDEKGWAPLHIAASFGHLDILKWLSISGVNLLDETRTGYTAIHLAAMNGHVNCIMILAAMGGSISALTVDQSTPLHLAAMSGHIECVKWLLSNRAKLDATDMNGRTPLDLAEEYQHEECVRLLNILGKELEKKDSAIALLNDDSQDSVTNKLPPKPISKKTKQEERQDQELEEKKRVYAQQRKKLERRGSSFLDSIRQEIEEGEDDNF